MNEKKGRIIGMGGIKMDTGKNIPLDSMESVFQAMREAAKPGTCFVCQRSNVPVVTMHALKAATSIEVCIDCATGKTPPKLSDEQKN